MILYYIISYYIIAYHSILYYIISYCILSYHIILYCILSYHIISYHIIPYGTILYSTLLYIYILLGSIWSLVLFVDYDNLRSMRLHLRYHAMRKNVDLLRWAHNLAIATLEVHKGDGGQVLHRKTTQSIRTHLISWQFHLTLQIQGRFKQQLLYLLRSMEL